MSSAGGEGGVAIAPIVGQNDDKNGTTVSDGAGGIDTDAKGEEPPRPHRPSPPSHILADGTFVHLPPPTPAERSTYFQRAIAAHNLVSAAGAAGEGEGDDDAEADGGSVAVGEGEHSKQKAKRDDDDGTPAIHPLAVASARLQGGGVSELSKAINLANLVGTGEYFALANIVSDEGGAEVAAAAAAKAAEDKKKEGSSAASSSEEGAKDGSGGGLDAAGKAGAAAAAAAAGEGADAVRVQDQRLRALYLLKRKRDQFDDATTALDRHRRRLSRSADLQRVVDRRLLALRKRWRLAAPEHGTRAVGPARPDEVIAVDVEVYDRDRVGGGRGGDHRSGSSASSARARPGRLARMVPRYATIGLTPGRGDGGGGGGKDGEGDTEGGAASPPNAGGTAASPPDAPSKDGGGEAAAPSVEGPSEMEVDPDDGSAATAAPGGGEDARERDGEEKETRQSSSKWDTKAEPYAVADPTLGKLDLDFDPDAVPMLTLLLSVEKNSTGFVQSASLASSSSAGPAETGAERDRDAGGGKGDEAEAAVGGTSSSSSSSPTDPATGRAEDEEVILSLQHSLFCASLFDAVRQEILSPQSPPPSSGAGGRAAAGAGAAAARPTVWLSSEMDDAFLPPPLYMAGGGGTGPSSSSSGSFCVVHCQEGEVKVQLDAEYSLTVQLVEAGTVGHRREVALRPNGEHDVSGDGGVSGSQSPAQLHAICRALLLNAQFIYHDHCVKTKSHRLDESGPGHGRLAVAPGMKSPLARRKASEPSPPRILEQCVGFGSKVLFESKVRSVLKRAARWIPTNYPGQRLVAEWLPLSIFDSHSQFALSVGDVFSADVHIDGGAMRVTTSGDDEEYRSVRFSSDVEFEQYLMLALKTKMGSTGVPVP